MKYLLLLLMSLTTYAQDTGPKFYKGQQVTYKTGFFLHKVCSGKGKIDDFKYDLSSEDGKLRYNYSIKTPLNERDCPSTVNVDESEIKAAK